VLWGFPSLPTQLGEKKIVKFEIYGKIYARSCFLVVRLNALYGLTTMKEEQSLKKICPKELTHRLVAMDEEAWVYLYQYYRPQLVKLGCKEQLSRDDSEEIANETLLRAFSYFKSGKFKVQEGATIASWLFTVFRNRVRNSQKHSSNKCRVKSDKQKDMLLENLEAKPKHETATTMLSTLPDSDFSNRVRQVAYSLEAKVWRAYFRSNIRKISADKVAQELGISVTDVYEFNRQVKRKLKRVLGNDSTQFILEAGDE